VSAVLRPDVVIPELLQGQWTTALICTFGVNLTFFETRLMSQLAQVPLRIILADDERLASTLGEAARTGQRHRLANKAYVAAPIRHPRAAHGKLVLLLGPASGRLIVGSGNLGYDGYASPGELWNVFAYSDDQAQHLNEFAAARSFIDGLASRQLLDPPVVELLYTAWGAATWLPQAPTAPATIYSNLDRPIIEQLRDLAPDPVTELVAHAPFHDADCAALHELITTFEPKQVRLLVTDATSADPAAIKRTLGDGTKRIIELVQVKDEPAAYIHAKWVHLLHPDTETLLTGSANLSRSALLRASSNGNIEIGVISTRPVGTFDGLYAHLQRKRVNDVSSLGISYKESNEDDVHDVASYPAALWSRLDDDTLSITFSDVMPEGTTLSLEDHAGRALVAVSTSIDGATVVVKLDKESADRLADGGRVSVRINSGDDQLTFTWPYQLSHLRGRLDKAGQRERLPSIRDLPEQDAELYELLRELDLTLIIDRESVWRIAKPGGAREVDEAEQKAVRLEDLDWDRVRRDPRYGGYFTRGRSASLPPTDIQIVLAAIGGRLGDLGLGTARPGEEGEEDLAHEGDAGLSSESEDTDEELEDELTRRRLPVSTRTRMAFDRFVRRYASALSDSAFIDELGPIPPRPTPWSSITFCHGSLREKACRHDGPSTPRSRHGDSCGATMICRQSPNTWMMRPAKRFARCCLMPVQESPPCAAWCRHSTTPSRTTPWPPCGTPRDTSSRTLSSGWTPPSYRKRQAVTPWRRNSLMHCRKSRNRSPQGRSWSTSSLRTPSRDLRPSGVRSRFGGWAGSRLPGTIRRPLSSAPRSRAFVPTCARGARAGRGCGLLRTSRHLLCPRPLRGKRESRRLLG
jgi:hypothetical protein